MGRFNPDRPEMSLSSSSSSSSFFSSLSKKGYTTNLTGMKNRQQVEKKKESSESTLLINNKTNSGIYRSTPPTPPKKVRSRRISPSLVHGFGVATILIRNWHRYRYLTLGIMQSINQKGRYGSKDTEHAGQGTERKRKENNPSSFILL